MDVAVLDLETLDKGDAAPKLLIFLETGHVAVGQNPWYHFGVGAPPILVNFSGDWDVH